MEIPRTDPDYPAQFRSRATDRLVWAAQMVNDPARRRAILEWVEAEGGRAIQPMCTPGLWVGDDAERELAEVGDWVVSSKTGIFRIFQADRFSKSFEPLETT